jgi:hypothetical protein
LHEGLPDVTFANPDAYDAMPESERIERVLIDDDFCIIDGNRYFLRCLAEAPIKGFKESSAGACGASWTGGRSRKSGNSTASRSRSIL